MKNEKSSCPIKDMPCEIKLAYFLIIILFISNIFIFLRLKKVNANNKIKNWVDNNPKVILDSVQKYAEKQQVESQKKQHEETSKSVKENKDEIIDEKNTGVHNPKGKKTIVIFYDYNCGYCKMASKSIEEVVKTDKDIKVIFRELPIFGGVSAIAAKYSVAVALAKPNKFFAFHTALMDGNARDEEGIKEALKVAGIGYEEIHRIMKTKADIIEKRIDDNMRLAQKIGIQGTPALMVGDEFIPGYIDAENMRNKLND